MYSLKTDHIGNNFSQISCSLNIDSACRIKYDPAGTGKDGTVLDPLRIAKPVHIAEHNRCNDDQQTEHRLPGKDTDKDMRRDTTPENFMIGSFILKQKQKGSDGADYRCRCPVIPSCEKHDKRAADIRPQSERKNPKFIFVQSGQKCKN